MAGDWIPMRLAISDDPAVIAVAATLGTDEDLIVGKLHRLWSWADQHSDDGNAPGVTTAWIDRHVRMPGFADAIAKVGWLAIDPAGVRFPRFERWMGQSGKKRLKSNQRVAAHREAKRSCNGESVSKSVTTEEYRTEEKEKTPIPPHASRAARDDVTHSDGAARDTASRKIDEPPGFARFWTTYPDRRRADRAGCARVWRRRSLEESASTVLAGLARWLVSQDWQRDAGQFIPAPLVWLNKSRWEANPSPATKHAQTTTNPRRPLPAPAAFPEGVIDR